MEEASNDWKWVNVTPVFKKDKKEDSRNYGLVSLTSVPRKVIQQILLEPISRHTNDQNVIGNSQHGRKNTKKSIRLTSVMRQAQ